MGLSASQARLLTITARKSDCEFQSMRYSHEKIALSRDLTDVSNEYQNALNATKLVYDYYGVGSSADPLTYGLMMTPSEMNGYMPILTTDNAGRVVLSSKLAAAAAAAGIPNEGFGALPSSLVRNKFVEEMYNAGVITSNSRDSILSIQYSQDIGVGNAGTLVTTSTKEVDLNGLIDYISKSVDDLSFSGIDLDSLLEHYTGKGYGQHPNDDGTGKYNDFVIRNGSISNYNVEYDNKDSNITLSLSDILSGDYQFLARINNETKAKEREDLTTLMTAISKCDIWEWMFTGLESVLDTGDPNVQNALIAARMKTEELLNPSNNNYFSYNGYTKENASKYHGVIYCMSDDSTYAETLGTGAGRNGAGAWLHWFGAGEGHYSTSDIIGYCGYHNAKTARGRRSDGVSIDISNIARAYLTYFAQEYEGMRSNNYYVDSDNDNRTVGKSQLIDENFTFNILSDVGINQNQSLESGFYDALFNQICLRGWTENDNVKDKEYLQEMYKSGKFFMTTCADDGFYYQGGYATNTMVKEVTDEEAIAKAEAKYNTEKQKINHKEEIIDMKMKNLDTEISSLTTEYETIKSVLKNNIDKSFTRYEA